MSKIVEARPKRLARAGSAASGAAPARENVLPPLGCETFLYQFEPSAGILHAGIPEGSGREGRSRGNAITSRVATTRELGAGPQQPSQ